MGAAHDITSVKLYLTKFSNPLGNFEVSIRATDGQEKPYGADLAYGSIPCSSIGVAAWKEITFGTPYAILEDTKHAIVVRATEATGSKYIIWLAHYTADEYADGAYMSSTNSGVSWGLPSAWDCLFQEFEGAVKYESYEGTAELYIPVLGAFWRAQSFGYGKLFVPNVQII